jgi:hypothetical protein
MLSGFLNNPPFVKGFRNIPDKSTTFIAGMTTTKLIAALKRLPRFVPGQSQKPGRCYLIGYVAKPSRC